MQETSLMAFDQVRPKIAGRRKQVYAMLAMMGPSTNAEVAQRLGWSINRVTPRMLELRENGWVENAGTRECKVTKNNAHAWRAR